MKVRHLLLIFLVIHCQMLVAQTMYVRSGNGVNLRKGPGTGYETVASIPDGSKIQVVSNDGDWIKVKYDGKTGYVSNQYVSDEKPKDADRSKKRDSSTDDNRNSSKRQSDAKSGSSSKSSSSNGSNDRNWGLGVRLGDPLGITAKKYFSNGNALEFSVGSTSAWGYDYENYFYEEDRYRDYEYVGYKKSNAIAFQVHYLFQKDIPNVKNLQWYWGVGGQLRMKSHRYNYRFRDYYGPGDGDFVWAYAYDKVTDMDFGADVVIGLEYHLPKAPLSIFLDANILIELLDDPFAVYGQGGTGIRYNF